MKGDGSHAAVLMTELLMGPTLTDFHETELLEDGDDLPRFQGGEASHLGKIDRLDAYELGLELGLAIFQEQGDDLL